MLTKDNFYTAYFIDNERKNIEVLLKRPDFKSGNLSLESYIIPFNEDNGEYKKLLEVCSLDQLHENTWEKKKVEREDFVMQVKKIAEEEGLIKKIVENVDPNFFNLLFDFLLSDKQEHIDRLFNFKIFMFEQEIVKNSKNEEIKTAIRKSKTPLEALENFIIIWKESN
tara:strand:- start:697 stop:1200 length:504 start_codon:yes stop_codon:yes gene_type:complete